MRNNLFKKIVGLTLMILSILFFFIFLWWGVQNLNHNYAVGIILVSIGAYITGYLLIQNTND